MNPGQQQFYTFLMERVRADKIEEAKSLLEDSFSRQAAGTFDRAYLDEIMPKFYEIVKPEAMEDLKAAMIHFASIL